MSHGSELNPPAEAPSEKPDAKKPVEFSEFEAAVNIILTKYDIKNFHIKCSLTLSSLCLKTKHEYAEEDDELAYTTSWLYLNTTYNEENDFGDLETEPSTSLTENQWNIPFVQTIFLMLQQSNISSFHIDTWSPNNYGGYDHINVIGGKDFDYSHLLMQGDESTLAGSSSSALDHDTN